MCAAPLLLRHTSARILEFDSVREMLRGYSQSELGREKIAALAPTADGEWIMRQQQLAEEVRRFWRTGSRFEFGGLADIGKLLEKSRISGAALELEELREVLVLADRAQQWRETGLHPHA
jgi:DNA mismatch repair protein MutS2